MSVQAFNGKVILSGTNLSDVSTIPGSMLTWDGTFSFVDNTGKYLGTDAQIGDLIVLDTSGADNATVTSYVIQSFIAKTYNSIQAVFSYSPSNNNPGGAPDISNCVGLPGAIVRRSPNGQLASLPSIGIQLLPDFFPTQLANDNTFNMIDPVLSTNGELTPTSIIATGAISAANLSGTNTGDQTITLTGDVTGTGTGSFAATLAASGVTAGTYGSTTSAPTFTVDTKGRLTTASAVTITPAFSSITGKPTTLAGYGITDAIGSNTELNALGALSTTGFIARTSSATYATRTLAVSGTGLSISNADGLTGNPTITLNSTPSATTNTIVARDSSGNLSANIVTASLVGNASTASALSAIRTISITGDANWTTSFDGSANATGALTLAASGVTAGTYKSVTVDTKGRVTAGTNPTTLAGYGITDAVNASALGTASGVATLDATGKLTSTQLPASVVGGMNYQGTWNAATNTPTLANGVGTKGYFYKVSVAGTTNIDGNSNWTIGDIITFDGTIWDQIQGGTSDVSSVFGRIGAVTLTSGDVTTALGFTPYNATNPSGYTTNVGTVTSVSVASSNGFAGTVSNASTTPSITLSTTVIGILKGNGTAISAATSGTDYSAGTSTLATGIVKTTTGTGALSIATASDFPTLNQSTTGNAATVTNGVYTTDTGTVTNSMLAGSIANAKLTNSSVTINGASIALGASGTVTAAAGTLTGTVLASNIVSSSLTSVGTLTSLLVSGTITGSNLSGTNTGDDAANSTYANDYRAANFVAGTNYLSPTGNGSGLTNLTGANVTGTVATATTANALTIGNNYQVNSLGVGTAASSTAGEIRATNNITAYYSDDRLKTRTGKIEKALDKVATLDTFYYHANDTAQALGYELIPEVGISAQQVQAIMPEVVAPAPISDMYLTVRYERLVPLLIAAIQELQAEIVAIKAN